MNIVEPPDQSNYKWKETQPSDVRNKKDRLIKDMQDGAGEMAQW